MWNITQNTSAIIDQVSFQQKLWIWFSQNRENKTSWNEEDYTGQCKVLDFFNYKKSNFTSSLIKNKTLIYSNNKSKNLINKSLSSLNN